MMNKNIPAFLFFILFSFLKLSAQDINVYVATNGNDKNSGTIEKPLRTLEAARDRLRKNTCKDCQKNVFIREGSYVFSETLEFTEQDGGSPDKPVVYAAYKDEKVSLNGGIQIPVKNLKKVRDSKVLDRVLREVRDKLYEVDLRKLGLKTFADYGPRGFNRPYLAAPNELFINQKAQNIARWPNEGEKAIPIGNIIDKGSVPRNGDFSNRGAVFSWNTDRPLRWKEAKDVWISGLFDNGYADDVIKLADINQKDKTFKTALPHMYGFGNKYPWNNWIAHNLLEEIDVPGEYFIDKKSGILYLYPPVNLGKEDLLQLSVLEKPMISFRNASYISLDKLMMECTRGMGVYIEGGEGCKISNSIFRNMGLVAVNFGKGITPDKEMQHEYTGTSVSEIIGSLYSHFYQNPVFNRQAGKNHLVEDCDIYDMGAGGIILSGGDRISLEAGNNIVRNCRIYRFNRLDRSYKSAVNVDGVGNRIQHCLIYNAPATAIYLHGNDHIVEYNEVHNVMMDGDDQGAYYMGRDPSEFNNVVRYNYFHDIGISPVTHSTFAIYYDDGASGSIAFGNVFYKAGKRSTFLIGGGKFNKIGNNIFVENKLGIYADDRMANWAGKTLEKGGLIEQRLNAVHYDKPPYSIKYPELLEYWNNPGKTSNLVEKNVFYKTAVINQHFPGNILQENWETSNDIGFVDLKNENFSLKSESPVYKNIPGFEVVPFEKMGLYPSSFRNLKKGKDGRWVPED